MRCIISVDTEADNQWKWRKGKPLSLSNIPHLKRFQESVNSFGFPVTYLVTYEVSQHMDSQDMFKGWLDEGSVEIGAHLHPWTNPPFEKADDKQRYSHELSLESFDNKVRVLTDSIKHAYGIKPKSFRSGKWGITEELLTILSTHGYVVDSSITPSINWRLVVKDMHKKEAPDLTNMTLRPFKTESGILEVPMTIVHRAFFKEGSSFIRLHNSISNSLVRRVFDRVILRKTWCRIFPSTSLKHLIGVYKKLKKEGVDVIQIMTHSSELMVGGSPYVKSEKDLEDVYSTLIQFLDFLKGEGVKGDTLSSYAERYTQ